MALRKATNFIRTIEICAEGAETPKKAKVPVGRNPSQGDRRPQLECVAPRFTTDHQSILMEVRGHPVLKRSPLMNTTPKPHNDRKYFEFHKQNRQTTAECRELRKALH